MGYTVIGTTVTAFDTSGVVFTSATDGFAWNPASSVLTGGQVTAPYLRLFGATITAGGGNPIQTAKDFFDVSWGFPPGVSDWLFGIATTGFMTVGFGRVSKAPIIMALGAILGVGLAVVFGFFPIWVLLLIIFLAIAFTASQFLGGNGEEE
jgi:hypothetical protein